ncbi:MAG: hypothetical protein MRERV_3c088 [Mycoplasmataceae bacterium RV_VA103A]|nr:MAG: hypothetical protein MRERV_3c088 [Mycoplasmataceae bacterium RV_VA103A]
MEIIELSNKIKKFIIPNEIGLKYNGCVKKGLSEADLKEMRQYLDQLWEKLGRDNQKLNNLIRRDYECLSYEIENYFDFDRNK